jgi:protoheme ferro-lyase
LKKVKSADLKQFIEYLRVRTQYQERQIARLKSKAHNLKQIKLIFNYNHGQELVERFCEQLETYDN